MRKYWVFRIVLSVTHLDRCKFLFQIFWKYLRISILILYYNKIVYLDADNICSIKRLNFYIFAQSSLRSRDKSSGGTAGFIFMSIFPRVSGTGERRHLFIFNYLLLFLISAWPGIELDSSVARGSKYKTECFTPTLLHLLNINIEFSKVFSCQAKYPEVNVRNIDHNPDLGLYINNLLSGCQNGIHGSCPHWNCSGRCLLSKVNYFSFREIYLHSQIELFRLINNSSSARDFDIERGSKGGDGI